MLQYLQEKGDSMSFEDEEKRKQKLKIIKIFGTIMAIGFMLIAVFMDQVGPYLGFSQSLSSSALIKGLFFATGVIDLIMFTFVFK